MRKEDLRGPRAQINNLSRHQRKIFTEHLDMLSLLQSFEVLPVTHKMHSVNTAEAKTLLSMIRSLLACYLLKRVVLIADRGVLSVSNVEELGKDKPNSRKTAVCWDDMASQPFGGVVHDPQAAVPRSGT